MKIPPIRKLTVNLLFAALLIAFGIGVQCDLSNL